MEDAVAETKPPVRIEVSRPRLIELGPGVLRVRIVNDSNELLTCTLDLRGAVTDHWRDTPTMLVSGRSAERRVPILPSPRGEYIINIAADIERADGSRERFVGHIDREVEAPSSGPAAISVNISGGDGSVIDASELRLGSGSMTGMPDARPEYEQVELSAESIGQRLCRATLVDDRGHLLHVITGDRLIIGRDPDQTDVPALGHAVSRVHAGFVRVEGKLVVRHLSRTNTTVLNKLSVIEGRDVILPEDQVSMLDLGAQWRCEVSPIFSSETIKDLRRGLIERGFSMNAFSSDPSHVAGLLLTPDAGQVPLNERYLWINSAVDLSAVSTSRHEESVIMLLANAGLQAARLGAQGSLLEITDLRVGMPLWGGRFRVMDGY